MSIAGRPTRHSSYRLAGYALLSGLAAGLLALIDLCGRVAAPGEGGDAPALASAGGGESPVIAALWWAPSVVRLVSTIAGMEPGVRLIVYVALVCVPAYCLVSSANPTFRTTTGVDWDRTILVRTYMHTAPLIKVFLVSMAALVPLYVWWTLVYWVMPGALAPAVAAAGTGAMGLLALARSGVAGDLESGNYQVPAGRSLVGSLALRGAAGGLALWAASVLATRGAGGQLVECLAVGGASGQHAFGAMALVSFLWAFLTVAVGVGASLVAAAPGVPRRSRLGGMAALACVSVALAGASLLTPAWLRAQLDYAPRVGTGAALAAIAGRSSAPLGLRRGLVLGPGHAVAVAIDRTTSSGLSIDQQRAGRLEAHLRRRAYRTVLAPDALRSLYEAYLLADDHEAAMRTVLAALRYAPDPAWSGILFEAFETWGATAYAREAARRASGDGLFIMPTRLAWLEMGDMVASTGDAVTTRLCYQRAGVQKSRIEDRLAERLRFVSGAISGSLRLNGHPLAHVRVSAVSMAAFGDQSSATGVPGVMAPIWLRHCAADTTTGGNGEFCIRPLPEGRYRLLVWGPGGGVAPMSRVPTSGYTGTGSGIAVSRSQPINSVGEVDIRP